LGLKAQKRNTRKGSRGGVGKRDQTRKGGTREEITWCSGGTGKRWKLSKKKGGRCKGKGRVVGKKSPDQKGKNRERCEREEKGRIKRKREKWKP